MTQTYKRPFASVIIPVLNDGNRLGKCLKALSLQTYHRTGFEVIVVDNGSSHLESVMRVVESYENVVLAHEAIPSSYAARNKGIALAKGEIIAFTDSDCIPHPNWLELGIARLCDIPECRYVVGKVNLFFLQPDNPTTVELYESLTAFRQDHLLKKFHGGATANILIWRHVIDRVGDFDINLKSTGDIEWGKRIFEAGYVQIYAPDVQVDHPARQSLDELRRRTVRLSGGVFDRFVQSKSGFIQRQKMFARLLVDDLNPPVDFIFTIFRRSDIKSSNRLNLILLMFYVRYLSIAEKIWINLGKVSSRS